MYKQIGRNSPCPCGSGKKFKKCHYTEPGMVVLETVSYGEKTSGVFRYMPETHLIAETGQVYCVHIYSSVLDLIENNEELKQSLGALTVQLMRPGMGDVGFLDGAPYGIPDDFFVWYHPDKQVYVWFTVTQAKSHFGAEMFEALFGATERQAWGTWGKQAVSRA